MGKKGLLAILCLFAGAAPLAYRFLSGALVQIAFSIILLAAYTVLTSYVRRNPRLNKYWELSFAFAVLALFGLLNDLAQHFGTVVLNDSPVNGDPLAGTEWGSVAVQLFETLLAIVPVVLLTRLVIKRNLGSIYYRVGSLRRWFPIVIAVSVILAIGAANGRTGYVSTNGAMTPARFIPLIPALFIMVIPNGFQEETMFRGLYLQKYDPFFSRNFSLILQAAIFSSAHLGVTYAPSAIIFSLLLAFPLGLITGVLMRRTNGILTPAVLHIATDIPIYLSFLTYVT